MKERDIIEVVDLLGVKEDDGKYIVATIMPAATTYIIGAFAAFAVQNFVLYFTKDKLVVLGLNSFSGKPSKEQSSIISKEEIRFMSFYKKMTHYQLSINIGGQNLEYRINKKLIGAKWHKENLDMILKDYKVV